ncbi:hypothetical protein MUK42_10764 [Musa troglodytarum]|uniref:Uncharacterized protein n=1 Tax=Musa troglodytarum TaxID=320322 RepID=A0A9E7GSN0_9LILI|nr:hypothetical protein MUK42_10764 [Musa troglodytarum]
MKLQDAYDHDKIVENHPLSSSGSNRPVLHQWGGTESLAERARWCSYSCRDVAPTPANHAMIISIVIVAVIAYHCTKDFSAEVLDIHHNLVLRAIEDSKGR